MRQHSVSPCASLNLQMREKDEPTKTKEGNESSWKICNENEANTERRLSEKRTLCYEAKKQTWECNGSDHSTISRPQPTWPSQQE